MTAFPMRAKEISPRHCSNLAGSESLTVRQASQSPYDPDCLKMIPDYLDQRSGRGWETDTSRPPTEAASKIKMLSGLSITANRDGDLCPSHSDDHDRHAPCGRVHDLHEQEQPGCQ